MYKPLLSHEDEQDGGYKRYPFAALEDYTEDEDELWSLSSIPECMSRRHFNVFLFFFCVYVCFCLCGPFMFMSVCLFMCAFYVYVCLCLCLSFVLLFVCLCLCLYLYEYVCERM